MPRYFFHSEDGLRIRDEDGAELPDLEAAGQAAAAVLGEILLEKPGYFWSGRTARVIVTDEAANTLFVIEAAARVPAAATPSRPGG
jgi:hypothetical protein